MRILWGSWSTSSEPQGEEAGVTRSGSEAGAERSGNRNREPTNRKHLSMKHEVRRMRRIQGCEPG